MPIPAHISDLAASVLNRTLKRKGQIAGLLWERPLKVRKGVASRITKEVRCVARLGIEYDAQRAVQDARADGELPPVNAGLPWGQWAQYPYLIEHGDNLFIRLYPVAGRVPRVRYLLNDPEGNFPVDKAYAETLCLASEFREHTGGCLTLNVSHLRRLRVGGQELVVPHPGRGQETRS